MPRMKRANRGRRKGKRQPFRCGTAWIPCAKARRNSLSEDFGHAPREDRGEGQSQSVEANAPPLLRPTVEREEFGIADFQYSKPALRHWRTDVSAQGQWPSRISRS